MFNLFCVHTRQIKMVNTFVCCSRDTLHCLFCQTWLWAITLHEQIHFLLPDKCYSLPIPLIISAALIRPPPSDTNASNTLKSTLEKKKKTYWVISIYIKETNKNCQRLDSQTGMFSDFSFLVCSTQQEINFHHILTAGPNIKTGGERLLCHGSDWDMAEPCSWLCS